MIKTQFILFLLFLSHHCIAQSQAEDTIHQLSEVQVVSDKLNNFTYGLKKINLDSLSLQISGHQNISELLQRNLPVYIKSYGQGSLATISFRGTSPEHTGVYWNGFKINSPNIGMQDLALLPSTFFNSIEILHGGSSSLFGGGNIGGSIHLDNLPDFKKDKKIIADMGTGSFHNYQVRAKAILSGNKLWSSTALQYNKSLNDFTFTNLNNEEEKRENAAIKRISFIQDFAFNHKNNLLKASIWLQDSYREIPKTLTTGKSLANQNDQSLRASAEWKTFFHHSNLKVHSGFFFDNLNYDDPLLPIHSNIRTLQLPTEIAYSHQIHKRLSISSGLNYTYQKGISNNYGSDVKRNQLAVYASAFWKIPWINWKSNGSLRFENVDNKNLPLVYSIGMEGKIWKYFSGLISASRNYRLPSFNDLYWQPYGNPDLLPEDAFSKEVGVMMDLPFGKKNNTTLGVNWFNIKIDDRIIWTPENTIWKPENIQKVFSRGIELTESTDFSYGSFFIHLMFAYSYIKSTNESDAVKSSFHKQLIYVPEHNFTGNAQFIYKGYFIELHHQFVTERYTLTDNSASLLPYHLNHISIIKKLKLYRKTLAIKLNIQNIFDVEYEAVQYYPVAGRLYYFGIEFRF